MIKKRRKLSAEELISEENIGRINNELIKIYYLDILIKKALQKLSIIFSKKISDFEGNSI